LARVRGIKKTAEEVETNEQRDTLKSLGCNNIQGFLMSRPIGREETICCAPEEPKPVGLKREVVFAIPSASSQFSKITAT
jgi:EAL domain-containing protein (putative c-di-GMP-specific phosphodiesterase class I)